MEYPKREAQPSPHSKKEKNLVRSKKDRIIAGVCGGIAEYFDIRPVAVRIVAILLTVFFNGLGLILYLLGVVFIPDASGEVEKADPKEKVKDFVKDVQVETQGIAKSVKKNSSWVSQNSDIVKTIIMGLLVLVILGWLFPYQFMFFPSHIMWILFLVLVIVYFMHRK